eukprot:gene6372-10379_t
MSWRCLFSKNVHEVSFYFCGKGKSSFGMREFLKKNHSDLEKLNPFFPFLIRPMDELQPYIIASYSSGKEDIHKVDGFSEDQIEELLKKIVKTGVEIPKPENDIDEWADIITEDEKIRFVGQHLRTIFDPHRPKELSKVPSKFYSETTEFPIPLEKVKDMTDAEAKKMEQLLKQE